MEGSIRIVLALDLDCDDVPQLLQMRLVALKNDLLAMSGAGLTCDTHHLRDMVVALEDVAQVSRRILACHPRGRKGGE